MKRLCFLPWIFAAFSSFCVAQSDHPSLITRQQFANVNLLFATERTTISGYNVIRTCVRIQTDGTFHREKGDIDSKTKYGESGKLSTEELTRLRNLVDDKEIVKFRQSALRPPRAIRPAVGDQTFSLSIPRGKSNPQDLVFYNSSEKSTEPPKVRVIHQLLRELVDRKDTQVRRVAADNCREHIDSRSAKP